LPPQNDTWVLERLIVAKPEMAERLAGWDQFGGFAWVRILSRRPEFADRCDWSKLKSHACRLLMRQPQFGDEYNKWEALCPYGGDKLRGNAVFTRGKRSEPP